MPMHGEKEDRLEDEAWLLSQSPPLPCDITDDRHWSIDLELASSAPAHAGNGDWIDVKNLSLAIINADQPINHIEKVPVCCESESKREAQEAFESFYKQETQS